MSRRPVILSEAVDSFMVHADEGAVKGGAPKSCAVFCATFKGGTLDGELGACHSAPTTAWMRSQP